MRLFTIITQTVFSAAVGALLAAAASLVYAQALPTPQAPTCEVQLDAAQRVILQLRKQAAQAEFQNVTMQEQLMDIQKKEQAAKATPAPAKAAEKK